MAQNITLLGASYPDVPGVVLPKTGGGSALFSDTSVVTASASDVAVGKYFLDSSGNLIQGTAKIAMEEILYQNESPGVAQRSGTLVSDISNYNMFFIECCWGTSYTAHRAGTWVYVPSGTSVQAHASVDWYEGSYDAHVYRIVTIDSTNGTISVGTGNRATGTTSGVTESTSYAVITTIIGSII